MLGIVSRLTAPEGVRAAARRAARAAARARTSAWWSWAAARRATSSTSSGCATPGRTRSAIYRGYNNELAHRIEAGADMFLMPSRYEPCGLNQMYSLKYGTVPVVRRTGGLADTVEPFDPATGAGHRLPLRGLRARGAVRGPAGGPRGLAAARGLGAPGAERHGAGLLVGTSGPALRGALRVAGRARSRTEEPPNHARRLRRTRLPHATSASSCAPWPQVGARGHGPSARRPSRPCRRS